MNHRRFHKPVFLIRMLILPSSRIAFAGDLTVPDADGYQLELELAIHGISGLAVPRQARSTDSKEMGVLIDGIMADEMKTDPIPGAIVSVVTDGQLIFAKGYGYSDYENTIPVDSERTLFRVGSISKQWHGD